MPEIPCWLSSTTSTSSHAAIGSSTWGRKVANGVANWLLKDHPTKWQRSRPRTPDATLPSFLMRGRNWQPALPVRKNEPAWVKSRADFTLGIVGVACRLRGADTISRSLFRPAPDPLCSEYKDSSPAWLLG